MMTVRSEKLRAGSLRLTILLFILSLWSASVQAQEFSVAGPPVAQRRECLYHPRTRPQR